MTISINEATKNIVDLNSIQSLKIFIFLANDTVRFVEEIGNFKTETSADKIITTLVFGGLDAWVDVFSIQKYTLDSIITTWSRKIMSKNPKRLK